MIYVVRINDKEYEVEVERGQANIVNTTEVAVAAPAPVTAPAAPAPAPQAAAPAPAAPAAQPSEDAITSPMPGTILDIRVTPGTSVKMGEVLLILEAMKMENEIAAPADGVVAQVHVTKGASVSTGDALISMQ